MVIEWSLHGHPGSDGLDNDLIGLDSGSWFGNIGFKHDGLLLSGFMFGPDDDGNVPILELGTFDVDGSVVQFEFPGNDAQPIIVLHGGNKIVENFKGGISLVNELFKDGKISTMFSGGSEPFQQSIVDQGFNVLDGGNSIRLQGNFDNFGPTFGLQTHALELRIDEEGLAYSRKGVDGSSQCLWIQVHGKGANVGSLVSDHIGSSSGISIELFQELLHVGLHILLAGDIELIRGQSLGIKPVNKFGDTYKTWTQKLTLPRNPVHRHLDGRDKGFKYILHDIRLPGKL